LSLSRRRFRRGTAVAFTAGAISDCEVKEGKDAFRVKRSEFLGFDEGGVHSTNNQFIHAVQKHA